VDRPDGEFTERKLRWVLPQVMPLMDEEDVELRVRLVGERPPLLKVPGDVRVLPPPRWDGAFLPRKDALVAVQVRRFVDEMHASPDIGTIRETLPPLPADELELMMLELDLSPMTNRGAAERQLKAALRRAGGAMALRSRRRFAKCSS